jgi:hypothetical protein
VDLNGPIEYLPHTFEVASMSGWQECLQKSPIGWLLERKNPSIRYFTLRDFLGQGEDDLQVAEAKAAIPASDIVVKIFSRQRREGHWEEVANPYFPKYKATYWRVMTPGQLGVDKGDDRVQRSCDHAFSLQLKNGRFSSYTRERALSEHQRIMRVPRAKGKSQPRPELWARALVDEHEYSCLTGNMFAR